MYLIIILTIGTIIIAGMIVAALTVPKPKKEKPPSFQGFKPSVGGPYRTWTESRPVENFEDDKQQDNFKDFSEPTIEIVIDEKDKKRRLAWADFYEGRGEALRKKSIEEECSGYSLICGETRQSSVRLKNKGKNIREGSVPTPEGWPPKITSFGQYDW